jgi:hypothetical protein
MNKMTSLEFTTGTLEIFSNFLERQTGIELTWNEKAGLKMYLDKFKVCVLVTYVIRTIKPKISSQVKS